MSGAPRWWELRRRRAERRAARFNRLEYGRRPRQGFAGQLLVTMLPAALAIAYLLYVAWSMRWI
jgi:hypothetical protein